MLRELMRFALLAALTLAAYSNHFENSFHFDDFHTIVENARVHSLHDPMQFFRDPTAFSVLTTHQVFRPLVSLSLAVDHKLAGGAKPRWFHISTFFWFLVLLASLQLLFQRLLQSSGWAWFATAIFALHPVSAETVNYIIQRGDLYATLGITAALLIYIAWPKYRNTGLYLIPFAIGALSKATAMVFALLLALYLWTYGQRRWQSLLPKLIPSALAAIVLGVWIGKMTGAAFQPGGFAPGLYRATQGYVTWHYFYTFFLPTGLTADTEMRVAASYGDPRVFGGIIFLLLLGAVIYIAARHEKWRGVAFGLGWFVIALIPTAVIPLAEVANDHRMFMAFPGLCLAVTLTLKNLLSQRLALPVWRYAAYAAAISILAAAAYGTHLRNKVWLTEETLWQDVTVKSPANGRGLMNYGLQLMARGDTKTALDYFERAAVLNPRYHILEINRAIAKGELGRGPEAEAHFRNAIQWNPTQSTGYVYYGRWLNTQRRPQEAATHLHQALLLNPNDFQARALLMQVRAGMQQWKELRELVEETLRIAPAESTALHYKTILEAAERTSTTAANTATTTGTPEAYMELSLAHFRAGRYMECVRAAEQALRLRPDYAEAYNNIAAGYNALKMWDQGIQAASEAVRLKPGWDLARNNLAHAIEQRAIEKAVRR